MFLYYFLQKITIKNLHVFLSLVLVHHLARLKEVASQVLASAMLLLLVYEMHTYVTGINNFYKNIQRLFNSEKKVSLLIYSSLRK